MNRRSSRFVRRARILGLPRFRRFVRREGERILIGLYVVLILFLLAVSVGWDPDSREWRLGSISGETIVLALLLFLPAILPRIKALSFPFGAGQASVEFLEERIEVQEEKVAKLSNETDLLLNSLAANVLAPGSPERRDAILISCQRGTEQKILGALLKRLFQAALRLGDDKIAVEYESGGGALTFISLYRGKTDVCPAYTWQGYEMTLGPSLRFSAEELRRLNVDESIRRLDELYEHSELQWLPHLGFSSNWELVMLDEKAAALSIDAVEDLPSKSGRLTLGCPREFFARDAAYGSLEREGNEFSKVVFLEGEELYDALLERRVDVVVGFSTDPRLDSSAFRALKPTRQLFGDHYAVPVAREEIVSKYPGIRQAVQRLGKAIDGAGGEGRQHIRELVRRAEGAGSTPAAVELIAEDFLKRENLL